MTFIRNFCRILLSLTLLASGLLKLIDPVGTSLKIVEYFGAFHLSFLDPISLYVALAISALEFTLGVGLIMQVKTKLVSKVTLFLISFFTLVTLYLTIFNPIDDCGCFGEAIHLTNFQTFIKNIILLGFAYITYRNRERFAKITTNTLEWLFLGFYACCAIGFGIFSLKQSSHIDFTDYPRGANLVRDTTVEPYISTFIYELDGIQQRFDINNIPDDKWTYIETSTVENPDFEKTPDFYVYDSEGIEISDSILSLENAVVSSIYNPERIKDWDRIVDYGKTILANGGEYFIVASRLSDNIPTDIDFPIYLADNKILVSMNRSNGGITFIKDGIIGEKKYYREIPLDNELTQVLLNEDEDSLVIKSRIKARLTSVGICVVFIILLFFMKNICHLTYRGNRKEE